MSIIEQIRSLPDDSQWEIVGEILETLSPATDDDVFEKRANDLKSGKVKPVSYEEVKSYLDLKISK